MPKKKDGQGSWKQGLEKPNNNNTRAEDEERYRCLICNIESKVQGIQQIRPEIVVDIDSISFISKETKKADVLIKGLCSIYDFPCKFEEESGTTNNKNEDLKLEHCKVSPYCSICETYVDEFFRQERHANELIRQMGRLKHSIGSLIVQTYALTPSSLTNYEVKKRIYEAWFPKDGPTPEKRYRRHSEIMKEGVQVPLPHVRPTHSSSTNQKKRTSLERITPLPLPRVPITVPEHVIVDSGNIKFDIGTPMPSPLSVGRVDSDMEDFNDNPIPDNDSVVQLPGYTQLPVMATIEGNEGVTSLLEKVKMGESDEIGTAELSNGITEITDKRRRRNHPKKIYNCPYCNKSTALKSVHETHVRKHTGEKPFACKYCPRKFNDPHNKTNHELHSCKLRPPDDEMETMSLPKESKSKVTKTKPDKQIRTRRKREAGEIRIYKCFQCDKQWDTVWALKVHFEKTHPGENPFKCGTCERTFADYGNKLKHEEIHNESRYTADPSLECDICGKKYRFRVSLYHHRRYVHLGVPRKRYSVTKNNLRCDICGRSFAFPHRLKRHKLVVHDGKRLMFCAYKCEICDKPCRSGFEAKQHENTHKPNKTHEVKFQYKCPECPNHLGFNRKDNLRRHFKLAHPDVEVPEVVKKLKKLRKLLVCPKCPPEQGATFYNSLPLKRHIKRHHTGENPPPYPGPRILNKDGNHVSEKSRTKTRRSNTDQYSESSEDEGVLEFDDSISSEDHEESSSESEVAANLIPCKRFRSSNKTKPSPSGSPQLKRAKSTIHSQPSFRNRRKNLISSGLKQKYNHFRDKSAGESSSSMTSNTEKFEMTRRSNQNPSSIELKKLSIHLKRVDELDQEKLSAETQVRRETIETPQSSLTMKSEKRTNPIAVMSLSKIASFINSSTSKQGNA